MRKSDLQAETFEAKRLAQELGDRDAEQARLHELLEEQAGVLAPPKMAAEARSYYANHCHYPEYEDWPHE